MHHVRKVSCICLVEDSCLALCGSSAFLLPKRTEELLRHPLSEWCEAVGVNQKYQGTFGKLSQIFSESKLIRLILRRFFFVSWFMLALLLPFLLSSAFAGLIPGFRPPSVVRNIRMFPKVRLISDAHSPSLSTRRTCPSGRTTIISPMDGLSS